MGACGGGEVDAGIGVVGGEEDWWCGVVFVVEGIMCSCWGRRNTLKHGQVEWMDCGRIEDMSNEIGHDNLRTYSSGWSGSRRIQYTSCLRMCGSVLRYPFQLIESAVAVSLISQPATSSSRVSSALKILLRHHQARRSCCTFDRGSIA